MGSGETILPLFEGLDRRVELVLYEDFWINEWIAYYNPEAGEQRWLLLGFFADWEN